MTVVLSSVRMEEYMPVITDRGDFFDRLYGSYFIVRSHHRDQRRSYRLSERFLDVFRVYPTSFTNGQENRLSDADRGSEDGMVLNWSRDDSPAPYSVYDSVVSFGSP